MNETVEIQYRVWNNFTFDVYNFKQNPHVNYMTEHINNKVNDYGAKSWYNECKKINLLKTEQIIELINKNDKYGNPYKVFVNNEIPKTSSNTLKYIYFGLLQANQILKENIKIKNILEMGGGFGGQCLITQLMFDMLGIEYDKYILIDLPNIIEHQKEYLKINNMEQRCEFITTEEYKNMKTFEDIYIFSSYSLSEISYEYRHSYYKLFNNVCGGIIVWNAIKHDFTDEIKSKFDIDISYCDTCSIINNETLVNGVYNTNNIVYLKLK